jgi:hypothetical protein
MMEDGAIAGSVCEDFDASAVTQVVADFAWPERGDPQVSFEFVRCDFPQRPDWRGELVFGRSETNAHESVDSPRRAESR